ncbi:MAG: hypothetical protein HQL24_04110 [Candidatus Omnitrophica bacterium]|nr:hypothetical protein [Candidatus Omnitrophota bacterium]
MIKEINKIIKEETNKLNLDAGLKSKLEDIFRYERECLDQQSPRFKETIKSIIEKNN